MSKKGTRIKLYNTLDFRILIYGSENWTVKSKDKSRFMGKTAKYTWRGHKTNEEILNELKVTSVLVKTNYKSEWIQHCKQRLFP
jgi:hypothetical protein